MIVEDKYVEAALEYFNAQPHPSAAAMYNVVVTETATKAAYARAFLEASGTVKERECVAELDPAYQAAKAAEAEAIFENADQRSKQKRAEKIIDVWQSEGARARHAERVR
jgi:hypothetical protein